MGIFCFLNEIVCKITKQSKKMETNLIFVQKHSNQSINLIVFDCFCLNLIEQLLYIKYNEFGS